MAEDLGFQVERRTDGLERPSAALPLAALERLVHNYTPRVRRGLVLISHVLPTAEAYIRLLATKFRVHVVAIPYSSDAATVARLRHAAITVVSPASIADIAPEALRIMCELSESGYEFVAQEIGGYLASAAGPLAQLRNCKGIVEDTSNGHWRYESCGELSYPVVSIARSPIKRMEDTYVGEALAYSSERIYRDVYRDVLLGKNVLILGYGRIGEAAARAFRNRGAHISISDISPVQQMKGMLNGFRTGPLEKVLATTDLLVGTSGKCSITLDVVAAIKEGAKITSGSSRRLECDLDAISRRYDPTPVAPDVVRWSADGRSFDLWNDGFPLNFRDESILGDALDAVYSELFVCIREVAEGHASDGLRDSADAIHKEVADIWLRVRGTPDGERLVRSDPKPVSLLSQYHSGYA